MTTNNSDSDPNFHSPLNPTSNAIIPIYPNPNLQLALSPSYDQSPRQKRLALSPSYDESPRKKRTKTVALPSSSSSSSPKPSPKPKYPRKPDPNAPKITRPCTECGKTFWSWKALFGHMRCHPERHWRGINPPPNHRGPTPASLPNQNQRSPDWLSHMTEEDYEAASCLLMMANSTPSSSSSCGERFECGGCKKVFGSHQALGGHRASHKNVKGCFAITNVADDPMTSTVTTTNNPSDQDHQGKIVTFTGHHKCNVCFRVFSSGQALGGHMRCHWEKEEETMVSCGFDLNVPATTQDLSTSDTSGCSLDLRLGL